MRLFIGTEVEGPDRGKRTLFVSGDVPYDVLLNEFHQDCDYSMNIYFGADDRSFINWKTVAKILNKFWKDGIGMPVYAEVDVAELSKVPTRLFAIWNFTLIVFGYSDELKKARYTKNTDSILVKQLVGNNYVIAPIDRLYVSAVDDPLYKKDFVVWTPPI